MFARINPAHVPVPSQPTARPTTMALKGTEIRTRSGVVVIWNVRFYTSERIVRWRTVYHAASGIPDNLLENNSTKSQADR